MTQYLKQKNNKKKNYNLTNLDSIFPFVLLFFFITKPAYTKSSTINNILDFGIKPNGKINKQSIIQNAIDKASLSDKEVIVISQFYADKKDYRPAFVFDDVSKVELNEIKIQENKSAKKQIVIRNTKEINFDKQIVDLIEEVE